MNADFPLLVKTLLTAPLQTVPEQQIISDGLGHFTYSDFAGRLEQLAGALSHAGVGEGNVVGVMDWDTHRYLECFFAVPMMGAILHTINIRLSPAEIAYTIDHAEDDVILAHVDFLPLLGEAMAMVERQVRLFVMRDAPTSRVPISALAIDGIVDVMMAAAQPEFDFPDFDESLRATCFYTTGTTGNPKGVAYTHRQLVLHTMGILSTFGPMAASNRFHSRDVYMPITPMFHVHGWGFPYAATMLGLKQIYPGRYQSDRLVRLIDRYGVTFSHCVPTILHMLLTCDAAEEITLAKWKVVIGGSALPRGLAEAALARGINVFSAYGLSETCPLLTTVHLDPADESDVAARLKTGRPAAMVELRVVDAEMQDVPRDGVSTGEIVVRAPWLNEAYLKDASATSALWQGGYMHTGDVGLIEADGSLMITDRLKDVIKSGGEWISSLKLESIASAVDGVSEVAAIGVPHPKWGERPRLLLVLVVGADAERVLSDITAALEAEIATGTLSKWALPERIDVVAELARTSVGKIDKKRLRAQMKSD